MVDCTACGKPVPDGAADCPACGHVLAAPNDTLASPAPPTLSRAAVAPGSPAAPAEPRPRSVTGRYRKLKRIGGGGMGTVYLAQQMGVGNKVALKYLAPQLSQDEGLVRRFLQEGRVSVAVDHPGAAQLLDMGQDEEGQLFLAFEYVDGHDVRELLEREGRLPLEEARTVACRVAEVLAFAHERGIVHRDIKPENVRMRRDLAGTTVKVLDFGIARLTQSGGAKLTREGGVAGTPRYMAPEQIEGGPLDGRADVYALGLLLFEMLSGQPAFSAENVAQLFHQQLATPLPKLSVIDPRFDAPELDAVLARACAKKPADRFPDMKAVIEALVAAQAPGWPPVETARVGNRPRQLATPMPAAAPPHVVPPPATATPPPLPPAPSRLPLVLGLLGLLFGGGVAALRFPRPQAVAVSAVAGPAGAAACPGLEFYDPSLLELTVPQLEERVVRSRIVLPSQAGQQLETIKASLLNNAPARRECLYRMSLIATVASERTVLATPSMWGMGRPVKELETLFFELPTKQRWSVTDKKAVLARIESLFIANLKKNIPEDGEYWRRMYYALELRCEVTDEALAQLKALRPDSCLSVGPSTP